MKTQYKTLLLADRLVAQLYQIDPKLVNTKFGYAWKRFFEKNIQPTMTELNEKIEDLRIDNALTDKTTGEILYTQPDSRGAKEYKFNKDGLKKLTEQARALAKEFEDKEIDVQPYICKELPDIMLEGKKLKEDFEILKGLVL